MVLMKQKKTSMTVVLFEDDTEQMQLIYFIFAGKHMCLRANVLTTCRVALIAQGNLLEPQWEIW